MKLNLLAVTVFVVLLAGCAQTIMTKPGMTEQEFEQDKADCMFKIENGPNGTNLFMAKDLMETCMRGKGYHVVK